MITINITDGFTCHPEEIGDIYFIDCMNNNDMESYIAEELEDGNEYFTSSETFVRILQLYVAMGHIKHDKVIINHYGTVISFDKDGLLSNEISTFNFCTKLKVKRMFIVNER